MVSQNLNPGQDRTHANKPRNELSLFRDPLYSVTEYFSSLLLGECTPYLMATLVLVWSHMVRSGVTVAAERAERVTNNPEPQITGKDPPPPTPHQNNSQSTQQASVASDTTNHNKPTQQTTTNHPERTGVPMGTDAPSPPRPSCPQLPSDVCRTWPVLCVLCVCSTAQHLHLDGFTFPHGHGAHPDPLTTQIP